MAFEARRELSGATAAHAAAHVDWNAIDVAFGALDDTVERGAPSRPADRDDKLSEDDRAAVRRAFEIAREEFGGTLGWIGRMIRYAVGGIVFALALAVASGALLLFTPWASLISVATLGVLLGLLYRAIGLARDQAMLELIPARYALAVELSSTKRDLKRLQARFLDETRSLRKGAR